MKVISNTISATELSALISFDEELLGVPADSREEVLKEIGELLVEQVLKYCADTKSPIAGHGKFQKLSADYAEKKKAETGTTKANLDEFGAMLSALGFDINRGRVSFGIFGDQAPKADGHNNLSGKSKLPTRRFIPEKGETFVPEILDMVKSTIRFFKSDEAELDKEKLEDVETKSDLYLLLEDAIGPYTRRELKEAALSTPSILEAIDDYGLSRLL